MYAVQYSTIQYSIEQYTVHTPQSSTLQSSTEQYSTVQYTATVQYSTGHHYSKVHYTTVQDSTKLHNGGPPLGWRYYKVGQVIADRLSYNVVLQGIWIIGKTFNLFWVCILQKLFEISKSTTKNPKNVSYFFFYVSQRHILY